MTEHEWRVKIEFTDEEFRTRADALLDVGGNNHHGWGQARRNPSDVDVPIIGEEIAAARALIRLAHSLLGAAETDIEDIEHHPVRLHA